MHRLANFGRLSTALLMALAPAVLTHAQTSDSTAEFWPEVDVFVKLNQHSRLYGIVSGTKQQQLGSYADGQTGLHVDFYGVPALRKHSLINIVDPSRSNALMVRVGYVFSRPTNNSGSAVEHMPTVEGTARAHLSAGLLLSDRNRLDLRWLDGNPRHRYRNRLKLERTFEAWRFQLTPYAHAEVFYDLRQREWSRLRYAAGAEWNITKRIVLEAYYLRQNTWASVPQFVNAAGLALQFYFR